MLPFDFLKLLAITTQSLDPTPKPERNFLRPDLSDGQYADWFLDEKIEKGEMNPTHFLNDFVLFRVVFQWPRGAKGWTLDETDIVLADFVVSDLEAKDLVDMAREGLSDGYTAAAWYAKVAALRYVVSREEMPEPLFDYLQEILFLPATPNKGRNKADGLDRDRVIRNMVEGLLARNFGRPSAITQARAIAVAALGRKGIGITEDGIRKLCERAARSNRETRLLALLTLGKSLESKN